MDIDNQLPAPFLNEKGHLVVGGCGVPELAEIYGTPLHIVDTTRLRDSYRRFLAAFRAHYPRVELFCSYKTNCIPGVLKLLHEAGCGAEVVSPYELWLAVKLGVPPSLIIYNGPNKSIESLREAVALGVGLINVDSTAEIDRLIEASSGATQPVRAGLRICPGSGSTAQFGFEPHADTLVKTIRTLEDTGRVRVCALHTHIGSGIKSLRSYRDSVETLCLMAREIKRRLDNEIEIFDLGGGYGVPTVKVLTVREAALYKLFNIPPRQPRSADCPSPETFGEVLSNAVRRGCTAHGLKEPELRIEPGRALTSGAQTLLVRVRELKTRRSGKTFAMTDGGMQNIAFPLSYEYHECLLASGAEGRSRRRYFVTGPLCSSEDILYRNWELPELKEGDVLAIMDAGAYFTSFANNFSFARPAVVAVANGKHTVLRRRESFDHMSAVDEF
jgi:diaminopimelate decarboxylase